FTIGRVALTACRPANRPRPVHLPRPLPPRQPARYARMARYTARCFGIHQRQLLQPRFSGVGYGGHRWRALRAVLCRTRWHVSDTERTGAGTLEYRRAVLWRTAGTGGTGLPNAGHQW